YEAKTSLLIEKSDQQPVLVNDYWKEWDPEFLETQFQIIKSYAVAKRVVEILSLDTTYYSDFHREKKSIPVVGSLINWFSDLVTLAMKVTGIEQQDLSESENREKDVKQSPADEIAQIISDSISVIPVKKSRVVEVSYLSENPVLAKLIVNTVAKAYIEELLEMKMRASGYALSWLTKKAEEEREKLDQSEKALQEYVREKDIVTIEDRVAIIPQKMAELSTQLTKAQTRRKELEILYEKILSVPKSEAETIPVISSSATFQSIQEQILKSEQNIAELSKKYGKKHPVMKRARGELTGLNQSKDQEITRIIKSILNDYELAKSNEEDLNDFLERIKQEAVDLNEKFVQYGIMKREVDTNRHLYTALITKIKEQRITEQIQTINIWVIDVAETPKSPAKPRKRVNILLGLVLGCFGGIGLAFFIEYLDNTIKSPEDAEESLKISVLGIIPFLKDKTKNIEKVFSDEPSSVLTENYRAVRSAVMLSSAGGPPRILLVTSMSSGEGKTATAANLAAAIAKTGKSVLLADGDLRRPRLHKIFQMDNSRGLSTFLAGDSDGKILQKSSIENLSVMTSGPIPPTPSELLNSPRMKLLLKNLSPKFDHIIFDSPPVMSVTDSQILSKVSDGTIIVARSGQTTHEVARKGLKILTDIDTHILGMVINAVDTKKDGYGYYYGYDGYPSNQT
ncbi:MAG: polysaccharide biosynthesis tyrosine autokinase, partial [Desulfobacterales bacterium]